MDEAERKRRFPLNVDIRKIVAADGTKTTLIQTNPPLQYNLLSHKIIDPENLNALAKVIDKLIAIRMKDRDIGKVSGISEIDINRIASLVSQEILAKLANKSIFKEEHIKKEDTLPEQFTADIRVDYSKGLELKGSLGERVHSSSTIESNLKVLEALEKRNQK